MSSVCLKTVFYQIFPVISQVFLKTIYQAFHHHQSCYPSHRSFFKTSCSIAVEMRFTRSFCCNNVKHSEFALFNNFQVYKTQKSDHFFLLTCTISNFLQLYFIRVSIMFLFSTTRVCILCVEMVFKFSLISFVGVKKCERESSTKKEIINLGTHDIFFPLIAE